MLRYPTRPHRHGLARDRFDAGTRPPAPDLRPRGHCGSGPPHSPALCCPRSASYSFAGPSSTSLRPRHTFSDLRGIDPYTYLVDALQGVGQHPAARVAELTPLLWKQLFAHNPLRSDLHKTTS